jgi:hypothetical protein
VEELRGGDVITGRPRELQDATRDQGQPFSATDFQDEGPYLDKLPNSFNFEVCRARHLLIHHAKAYPSPRLKGREG